MTLHLKRMEFPDIPDITAEFIRMRPFGGASVIVADPNWKLIDWSDEGDKSKTPSHHYNCNSIEWMWQLPVDILAAKDCLLFMWATAPMLDQQIDVISAWGFQYKTQGCWVKRTSTGKVAFGTGRRLRSAHEPFLIATKGKPPVAKAIRSAYVTYGEDPARHIDEETPIESLGFTIEAQVREHSRKPNEIFDLARSMVPEGPAIELFSRQRRSGWTVWGNEIDKFQAQKDY